MSIPRKSPADIAAMRKAGRVVAEMHEAIRAAIRPGVTTAHLDQVARGVLERRGARSNFLGYHGYPAVTCISVNDVVIHGIPGEQVLAEGDVVSVDCGAIVNGWHGDAAFTAVVGDASADAARLIATAEQSLKAGIAAMQPGARLSDIGAAVEEVVTGAGYGLLRDYCGHGIGRAMHERPDVPNYGPPGRGPKLLPGVVLAVEPMLTTGSPQVRVLEDGWTVVTVDGGLGAHVEHTIAVTDHGPEILTR